MADNDVRIKLSLDGADKVKSGLSGVGDGAIEVDGKLHGLASGGIKGLVGAFAGLTAAAASGAAALGGAVVSQYADYEQNIGGIETMFKDSADTMKSYADEAYQTAGLSANDYMSSVTSFSAALLQGLGGDTEAAADMANTAMVDMSDNANKFGSNMGEIQQAYQGFAKQNYTMLDNLKLGYGGTQTEMARLINDSGVLGDTMEVTAETVNDVSFDKIIESIHTVQDEMDITGTTAKEASETISGSVDSTKAAFDNLIVGLGRGDADVAQLAENVLTNAENVVDNITPVIDNIGENMADLGPKISDLTTSLVDTVIGAVPSILQAGVSLIGGLLEGIASSAPQLATSVVPVIGDLVETIVKIAPDLVEAAVKLVTALADGLADQLPTLLPIMIDGILQITEVLIDNAPMLLDAGLELIMALADGLLESLPTLTERLPELIDSLVESLLEMQEELTEAGVELLGALLENSDEIVELLWVATKEILSALIDMIGEDSPAMSEAGTKIGQAIKDGFMETLAEWTFKAKLIWTNIKQGIAGFIVSAIEKGREIMTSIRDGFSNAISTITSTVSSLWTTISTGIGNFLSTARTKGGEIITNVREGMSNMFSTVSESVSTLVTNIGTGISNFFETARSHGSTMITNLKEGMSSIFGDVTGAISDLVSSVVGKISDGFSRMVSAGGDLVRGVWDGISGAAGWLANKAATWASNFISGVKEKFKIFSPSHVFRDEIGKQLMLGVAVGIDQNTHAPVRAIDRMFTKVQRSVGTGMRGTRREFDYEKDMLISSVEELAAVFQGGAWGYAGLENFFGSDAALKILDAVESYGVVAKEIYEAFQGGDWGYGELASYLGDDLALQVVNRSAALGEQYRKSVAIGKNLVGGMWHGIDSSAGALQNNVNRWAQRLIKDTKNQFGIASPSKVFRDAIGRNLMLGVADGINTNSYEVVGSVYAMFGDLQPALKDGMEGARQTIEEGVNSWKNPEAIKEVVDEFTGMVNELDRLFTALNGDMDSNSSGMMNTIGGNVSSGTPAVAGKFNDAGNAFNSNMAGGLNGSRHLVEDALKMLPPQVQKYLAPMVDQAFQIGTQMMGALDGVINQFGGSLGSILDSAGGSGGGGLLGGLVAAAKNIPFIGKAVAGALGSLSAIAPSLTSGLTAALGSMNLGYWGAIAGKVVSAAMAAFAINSPSKLMRDEIGLPLIEGIVLGLNNKPMLTQGVNSLSANMTKAARGAGDGMVSEMDAAAGKIENTFQDMNLDLAGGVAIGSKYLQNSSPLSSGTAYSMPVSNNYPQPAYASQGGSNVTFSGPLVSVDSMQVRNDQDIRQLSNQLSRDINRELRAQGVLQ